MPGETCSVIADGVPESDGLGRSYVWAFGRIRWGCLMETGFGMFAAYVLLIGVWERWGTKYGA